MIELNLFWDAKEIFFELFNGNPLKENLGINIRYKKNVALLRVFMLALFVEGSPYLCSYFWESLNMPEEIAVFDHITGVVMRFYFCLAG